MLKACAEDVHLACVGTACPANCIQVLDNGDDDVRVVQKPLVHATNLFFASGFGFGSSSSSSPFFLLLWLLSILVLEQLWTAWLSVTPAGTIARGATEIVVYLRVKYV